MVKNTKYHLIIPLLLFIVNSCIEPYKPDLYKTESEYILVVEGLITNEPGSFEVKLARSVPVDTSINMIPERGAHVMITDDSGNLYEFYESEPGVYKSVDSNAKAVGGREYQLNITDNQGINYESSLVSMKPTPEIKDVYWNEVTKNVFSENEVSEEKSINIFVESEEPEMETHYYKWDYTETWEIEMPSLITVEGGEDGPIETYVHIPPEKKHCWVTRRSAEVLIKSIKQQEKNKIDSFKVKTIPDDVDLLRLKYSIEIKQYALNKEMYDFWESIKEFNDEIGSMYDKIPYPIFGNIDCCNDERSQVLGYFNVAEVKTRRIFINNGDHHLRTINNYERCNYFKRPGQYHFVDSYYANSPFCADCRNTGSSTKPDFWD